MIRFENAFDSSIKITEIKLLWHVFILFWYYLEIWMNKLKTFHNTIRFVETCLREKEHYEVI